MKKVTREEVAGFLIKDKFFSKGNWRLKAKQIVIGIISWIAVFIPFIWIYDTLNFSILDKWLFLDELPKERIAISFLIFFLILALSLILGFFAGMTLWNNHNYKKMLKSKSMYDEERLEKRKNAMEQEFDARFGPKEERESICFYVVSEEQNLDTNLFKEVYARNEVKIK